MRFVRWFIILLMVGSLTGTLVQPAKGAGTQAPSIAFIRDGDLWVKINGEETKVTKGSMIQNPIWSHDGQWLAYSMGINKNQLWVYNVKSHEKHRVFQSGVGHYEWSPKENILAFQSGKVLNIAKIGNPNNNHFKNVILGVGNFSWKPDGKGFIVSSESNLLPTGWTRVKLFKVPMNANMDRSKAKHLFTLPPESEAFFAVGTSPFKWSHDGKWMSFIAYPTASMSADSDTLCILSMDGRHFFQADKMLMDQEWYKWAPTKNWLAYIAGVGRFAIENKHLEIKKLPAAGLPAYTPEGYVDRGLTWEGNQKVIVARSKEAKWNNDPAKRPMPVLFQIDVDSGNQKKLTEPPKGFGDFNPVYKEDFEQLFWVRTNRKTSNLMVAKPDGSDASIYIKNIDQSPTYYENRDWRAVMAIK